MKYSLLLLVCLATPVFAAEATPGLPPADVVARVLRASPPVQAAASQLRAEQANSQRLAAGSHEWSLRLGGQQRRSQPSGGPDERFAEWNVALERPLRLPGKAALDAELGAAGVAIAETAHGDALHENSRLLLSSWFAWLKESNAARLWAEQTAVLRQQAAAVLRRQQLGDAARLDSVQADAALAQAEAQLAQAELRQRIAGEELQRRFPALPLGEPAVVPEPQPVAGSAAEWLAAIVEHSHELGLAVGETRRARTLAERIARDRLADPTFGVQVSRERGGEENVVGAYVSIPLPGTARRAGADAASAQAEAVLGREQAARQKVTAEAAALYHSASASVASWQAASRAAEQLENAAAMTMRAYQVGEGSLNDLLLARRQALEARLAARLLQLEAVERGYRLQLDAHRLWEFDGHD